MKEVSLIDPHDIQYIQHSLEPYLTKSEFWTNGRATIEDILNFIRTSHMQLWVCFDTETNLIDGYVITEIKDYPQKRYLVAQYCAGQPSKMVDYQDKCFNMVERFARDNQCKGIEFFGRPGWRNVSRQYGFETRTVVYEKDLT